jgi:peptide-methionine (S)-S-oxide reductase
VVVQPGYEEVCGGETGHAECVNVYYDPEKISFETLVKVFFASHDPTLINRQGPDEGTQYRSIIFYRNASEKQVIAKEVDSLGRATRFRGKLVTEIKPFASFYPAEAHHQEYIQHHPDNPYIQHVSIPEFEQFRSEYKKEFRFKD